MPPSVYGARSSERILFRELFRDVPTVQRNGGVLTGSPAIKDGITVDGTQGISYAGHASAFDRFFALGGSVHCTITPDSVTSEFKRYFSYTSGNFSLTMTQNPVSLLVFVQVRNGAGDNYYTVSGTPSAGSVDVIFTWDPSVTTARLYLNGLLVATDNVAGAIAVGVESTERVIKLGINTLQPSWVGDIGLADMYADVLEQGDVTAIQNGSLFTYMQNADVWLDMKEAIIDGSNDRTLDKSRYGRDFQLGDGVGGNTPVFTNPGFQIDPAANYLKLVDTTGLYNNVEQSIVIAVKPGFNWDEDVVRFLFAASGGDYFLYRAANADFSVISLKLGGTAIAVIPSATYAPFWKTNGINIFAIAGKSADTDLYLNNMKILAADNTVWVPTDPASMWLGSEWVGSAWFNSVILHYSMYPFKLSSMQVRDLTVALGGTA